MWPLRHCILGFQAEQFLFSTSPIKERVNKTNKKEKEHVNTQRLIFSDVSKSNEMSYCKKGIYKQYF